jgi:hypothetical protein
MYITGKHLSRRAVDHLTIVSNTDCPSADPFTAPEIGLDHARGRGHLEFR